MAEELKRVMLVEDEPDIQVIAKIALETVAGFDLEICSNGQDALERAPIYVPQVLLLDVSMPGMDGPTTLTALRRNADLGELVVIMLTAKIQPSEVERYRSLGANDVIGKPFDPMSLGEQIRSIWIRLKG